MLLRCFVLHIFMPPHAFMSCCLLFLCTRRVICFLRFYVSLTFSFNFCRVCSFFVALFVFLFASRFVFCCSIGKRSCCIWFSLCVSFPPSFCIPSTYYVVIVCPRAYPNSTIVTLLFFNFSVSLLLIFVCSCSAFSLKFVISVVICFRLFVLFVLFSLILSLRNNILRRQSVSRFSAPSVLIGVIQLKCFLSIVM